MDYMYKLLSILILAFVILALGVMSLYFAQAQTTLTATIEANPYNLCILTCQEIYE